MADVKNEDEIRSAALAAEADNLREWLDGPGANLGPSDRASAAASRALESRVRRALLDKAMDRVAEDARRSAAV